MKSWKIRLKGTREPPRPSGLQVQLCPSLSRDSDAPAGVLGGNSSTARQPALREPAAGVRIPRALGVTAPARQKGRALDLGR